MRIFCLLLAAFSSPVFADNWKATVVKELEVLVTSCAVIPCTYTHPHDDLPGTRQRPIWHGTGGKDEVIFAGDDTLIVDNFKGRTRMVGDLGQKNCTLEMTRIRDHDNGPFCFRVELVKRGTSTPSTDKFSFIEDCVTFKMLPSAPEPKLTHPPTAVQGRPYAITCSVRHTCPSNMPKLIWSRVPTDDVIVEVHKDIQFGYWETESILTFTPEEKDDHSKITCTAEYNGGKSSETTLNLYVKRTESYNHIIIPTVAVIGTAVIFAVLCTVVVKRYRKRIEELQSRDGSLWNRMSRFSRRIRSHASGPSRADPRPANQKVTKGRFPSPKSPPKSCNYHQDANDGGDYMNAEDNNVYGNM